MTNTTVQALNAPRERLIEKAETLLEELENSSKVFDQHNRMLCEDVIEELKALNQAQALKVERNMGMIGPHVSILNYAQFK